MPTHFPPLRLKAGKLHWSVLLYDTPAASCTATSHNGIPGTRLCRQSRMHTRADAGGRTGGVRLVAGTVRLRVGAHGSGAPGQRRHQRAASAPRREGRGCQKCCVRGARCGPPHSAPATIRDGHAVRVDAARVRPRQLQLLAGGWSCPGLLAGAEERLGRLRFPIV